MLAANAKNIVSSHGDFNTNILTNYHRYYLNRGSKRIGITKSFLFPYIYRNPLEFNSNYYEHNSKHRVTTLTGQQDVVKWLEWCPEVGAGYHGRDGLMHD